jgi:hypothetical protein
VCAPFVKLRESKCMPCVCAESGGAGWASLFCYLGHLMGYVKDSLLGSHYKKGKFCSRTPFLNVIC